MNETCYGHPEKIMKVCEWTKKVFYVDYKHRRQRFINKDAMYAWRKSQNREIVNCLHCGTPFERYKHVLHYKTGKPTQYCSSECSRSSVDVNRKKREWGLSDKNHWNNPECQKKVGETKLARYGDSSYNNMEKHKQTCMTKYGVPYTVYLPQCMSNGKRISKFQRNVYEEVLKLHSDAKLECYMRDIQKSVDIFIPSENKVIECHGDYWHCNPLKFKPDYYNRMVHMTAQQIWDRDAKKKRLLEGAGYVVDVVWENTNKRFQHSIRPPLRD